MKKSDPGEERFRNTTCRYLGHEWKSTASPTYRICQRDQCRAAERLQQDGQWVSVLPSTRARKQQAVPQQSCLL